MRIFLTSGEPYTDPDSGQQDFAPAEAAAVVRDSPWAAVDRDGDVIIGEYRTRASWNGGKPVHGNVLARRLVQG